MQHWERQDPLIIKKALNIFAFIDLVHYKQQHILASRADLTYVPSLLAVNVSYFYNCLKTLERRETKIYGKSWIQIITFLSVASSRGYNFVTIFRTSNSESIQNIFAFKLLQNFLGKSPLLNDSSFIQHFNSNLIEKKLKIVPSQVLDPEI